MSKFNESNILFDETPPVGKEDTSSSSGWDRMTKENRKLASDWKTQIELAERRNEVWEKRCERIIKRFRDEFLATSTNSGINADSPKRMNIFWSNVQTLKPSIYSREPLPVAERKFLDRDPTGRVASQILERALRNEISESGFHDTVEQVVQDYLLVGRGTAWLRYKPLVGPASSLADRGNDQIDPSGDDLHEGTDENVDYDPTEHEAELSDDSKQEIDEKLLGAALEIDYVHWKDFLTSKARFWRENEMVARRLYLSRQDCVDAFGRTIGKEIPLEMTPETEPGSLGNRTTRAIPEDAKKAIVYEIWFKPKRKVYFIAKGYEFLLEEPREDPLGLEGFWPCPKPLYATMTNDTLEPVPDYIEYQDQAMEIDNLTNRIDSLIKALKVAGVYNAAEKGLARLLDEGLENQLIPVNSWAAFAEKGGIANAISFMPIKEIGEVLHTLFDARDKIKADLYEITGIADIMRGQADPRETAAAIQTKGRWGSLRLQQRQAEVARFCRDIVKMMGEIISDHYPDQTLIEVSGIMYDEGVGPDMPTPPSPPQQSQPGQAPMLPHPAMSPPVPGPPAQMGSAPQPQTMPGATPPAGGPGPMPPQPMPGGPPPQQQAPPNPQLANLMYQLQVQEAQQKKMAVISKAIALLRNDKLRGFRVDIETDSTINDNAKEEKMARVEFLTAMSTFVEKSMAAVQVHPEVLPLLGKSLLFTVRGFRVGRDLESSIEEFIDKAEQQLKLTEGQPKPPSPEQIKANADIQMSQASLQEAKMKMQADQLRSQAEVQAQQVEAQSEAHNLQMKQQMQQVELQIKQFEAEQRQQEIRLKGQYEQAQHNAKMQQLELETRAKMADYAAQEQARKATTDAQILSANIDAHDRIHEAKIDAQAREHEHVVDTTNSDYQARLKAHADNLKAKEKNPRRKIPAAPKHPKPSPLPDHPLTATEPEDDNTPPHPAARKAPDGKWYVNDPNRPGKYMRVERK